MGLPRRCPSISRDKNRRYIGKSQAQRPPKRTQRPPHRPAGEHRRCDDAIDERLDVDDAWDGSGGSCVSGTTSIIHDKNRR
jgi:hypothetical protein